MIDEVLRYAALGWKLLPIHGVNDNGDCTCGANHKGSEGSRGKHPILKDWGALATDDEEILSRWWEEHPLANVGILLGPGSQVIDVEFDDEEGRATADRLLEGIVTPSYSSGRSVHRLFRWTTSLPDKQKSLIAGLEIRLGGGGRQTQSVLPPSRHHSGEAYRWLDGLSPDECDVADLTPEIEAMIMNDEQPLLANRNGNGHVRNGEHPHLAPPIPEQPRLGRELHARVVGEGERNDLLLRFACRMSYRMRVDDPQERSDLADLVQGINATRCNPPLVADEVRTIVDQAVAYARRAANEGRIDQPPQRVDAPPPAPADRARLGGIAGSGLIRNNETGEWFCGDWRLTVVHSDPVEYRIHVPAWTDLTDDNTGDVTLSLEEYRDAGKVARKVQERTRTIILDEMPRVWPGVWNGNPGFRGIKAKLMDNKLDEMPPPVTKRFFVLAEYLQEQIEDAAQQSEPDPNGAPVYREDGTLWFRWSKIWHHGLQSGIFTAKEVGDFLKRLDLKSKDFPQWPPRGKGRRRYCVFTPQLVQRLATLASEHEEEVEAVQ